MKKRTFLAVVICGVAALVAPGRAADEGKISLPPDTARTVAASAEETPREKIANLAAQEAARNEAAAPYWATVVSLVAVAFGCFAIGYSLGKRKPGAGQ